jgi:hypothetical protein
MIEVAISNNYILPALILIYSGIDSASWLAINNDNIPVKKRFISWVNKFLLPAGKISSTAEELYYARCGILHTLTAYSDKRNIRKISYSYGTADNNKFQIVLDKISEKGFVSVHINDLYSAYCFALAKFFEESLENKSLADQIKHKAVKYFSNLAGKKIDNLLREIE